MALADLAGDLDYPMTIVTAVSRSGERSGCLVGFHTQCSIHPARWAVYVSIENHTYGVALESEALAGHFPGAGEHELAALFGSETGDDVDKFAHCAWQPGPHDLPLLDRSPHRFVGRVVDIVDDGGDHDCFVLEPEVIENPGRLTPLTFGAIRDVEAGHPA
jgi:flavin reductase (DIM6/NTAB) family NADH-FMN oxidoreductase RutF